MNRYLFKLNENIKQKENNIWSHNEDTVIAGRSSTTVFGRNVGPGIDESVNTYSPTGEWENMGSPGWMQLMGLKSPGLGHLRSD